MSNLIRIGTRKSPLALAQTMIVRDRLMQEFPELSVEIVKIDTTGDQVLDRSLTSFGGKGVFTAELEEELLNGSIDIAVHSAKDMPMEFPEGLGIGAALERADMRDTFVSVSGTRLEDLPKGSIVGTSSLRRELMIRDINPYVTIRLLRGNVHTRLRKLKEGQYDGIIMAAAGIERAGLAKEEGISIEYLDPDRFLPAAGQGILAIESRIGDEKTDPLLQKIHSTEAGAALEAERTFLKVIQGGCNAPAAAYAKAEDGEFVMHAMFAKDGGRMRKETVRETIDDRGLMETAKMLGERAAHMVNPGKVYLIGAGPGDDELITRKAYRLIREADVVIYDSLAADSLLNEVREDAELIYAGKRSSYHHLKQYETNELLIMLAREGKTVVRLKGGDPFVFGRGGEEGEELYQAGIDFEVVPGVSSAYAVPSYCGIPVTHREYASSFHVITGHEGDHKQGHKVLDYATLAKEEGTLIFLMGLKNLPNIVEELIAHGKDTNTPAAVLQEGTTAKQKVAAGVLADIVEVSRKEGIRTPAITVVGEVVNLRDVLTWFGKKPLSGKRILVTGSTAFSDRITPLLKEEGAEVVPLSLIRTERMNTESLQKAIHHIENYQWIVFTSSNGVESFFDQIREMKKDIRDFAHIHFAVIGDGTRKALERHSIYSDFMPTAYSSEDMAKALIPHLKKEDRVLLLRAQEANEVLPKALEDAGFAYDMIPLYHTVTDERKAEVMNRMIHTADYVTFASSSAVKAYVKMKEESTVFAGKYMSIGPVTTKTAEKLGLPIHKTAEIYTAQGIVDAIMQDVKENENTD